MTVTINFRNSEFEKCVWINYQIFFYWVVRIELCAFGGKQEVFVLPFHTPLCISPCFRCSESFSAKLLSLSQWHIACSWFVFIIAVHFKALHKNIVLCIWDRDLFHIDKFIDFLFDIQWNISCKENYP